MEGEDWALLTGDDNKRPFRDFPKRVPFKGYSEEGKSSWIMAYLLSMEFPMFIQN